FSKLLLYPFRVLAVVNQLRGSGGYDTTVLWSVNNNFVCGLLTRRAGLLFHLLAQAEWTHVGPDLFDVREAFILRTRLPRIVPTECVLAIGRPDRVLLFMV